MGTDHLVGSDDKEDGLTTDSTLSGASIATREVASSNRASTSSHGPKTHGRSGYRIDPVRFARLFDRGHKDIYDVDD